MLAMAEVVHTESAGLLLVDSVNALEAQHTLWGMHASESSSTRSRIVSAIRKLGLESKSLPEHAVSCAAPARPKTVAFSLLHPTSIANSTYTWSRYLRSYLPVWKLKLESTASLDWRCVLATGQRDFYRSAGNMRL